MVTFSRGFVQSFSKCKSYIYFVLFSQTINFKFSDIVSCAQHSSTECLHFPEEIYLSGFTLQRWIPKQSRPEKLILINSLRSAPGYIVFQMRVNFTITPAFCE